MKVIILLEFLVFYAVAGGTWTPQIRSRFQSSRSSVIVQISPPLPGATDYKVQAINKDDPNIFLMDSTLVNKSDTEVIYELKGFPRKELTSYYILVMPLDHGEDIGQSYLTSPIPVIVPPYSPPIPASTTQDSQTFDEPITNTKLNVETTSACNTVMINTEKNNQTAERPPESHEAEGFHLEIWMIVVGSIVLFLILVFTGCMFLMGCSGRSRQYSRSDTSFTSQNTTHFSETYTDPMMQRYPDGAEQDV